MLRRTAPLRYFSISFIPFHFALHCSVSGLILKSFLRCEEVQRLLAFAAVGPTLMPSALSRVSRVAHPPDVFLHELIYNSNDALEQVRLTFLTDKQVLEGAE